MNTSEFKELYKSFIAASNSSLSDEQFSTLLMFFPALLVVVSDGKIDQEEWTYIKYLAKFMSDAHIDTLENNQHTELTEAYSFALKWLVEHLDEWKKKFVSTLAEYLKQHPDVKEDILETLYMFSEASEGQSNAEIDAIEIIKKELGIQD